MSQTVVPIGDRGYAGGVEGEGMSNEDAMIGDLRWRRLRVAAWVGLVTHILAGLAMLTVLRNGLETNPVFLERAKYIADHVGLWRLAWFSWTLIVIPVIYFLYRNWENRKNWIEDAD